MIIRNCSVVQSFSRSVVQSFSRFVLSILVVGLLVSCDSVQNENYELTGTDEPSIGKMIDQAESFEPKTKCGTTFKKQLVNVLTTTDKTFDLLDKYQKQLNPDDKRSAAGNEPFCLDSITPLLPQDLSTLKRIRVSRASDDENVLETVTLESELEELIAEYTMILDSIKPDTAEAESLDFVERHEDILVLDDDTCVDPTTIVGMIQVEMLNAFARGEDIEDAVLEMEECTDLIFGSEDADATRGHYLRDTTLWQDGKVYYRWGSRMSDRYKNELKAAMNDWREASGNRLSFRYFDDTAWNNFRARLGLASYIFMSERDISSFGKATVGRAGGKSILYLNNSLHTKGAYFQRTPRHELGHSLGLSHEHQRWDRDEYIYAEDLDGSSDDIKKYDEKHKYYTWVEKKKWGVPYWVYVKRSKTYSFTPSPYDYHSIMHYNGVKVKKDRQGMRRGERIENYTISSYDKQSIKEMY